MTARERIHAILSERIMIGDGAIGTLLQMRGLAPGFPPEIMLLQKPQEVEAVHRLYIDAGADFVTTNTFGATRPKLMQHGLADRIEEINRRAVEAARMASDGKALVAGSVGPTGELMVPMGSLSMPDMVHIYREQIHVLKSAGADFAILETMADIGELQAASRACFLESLPFIALMTFNPSGRSLTGSTPEVVTITLEPYVPLAIGTNCGSGIADMPARVREFTELTDIPIIAQPNAGLPELVGHQTVFRLSPDDFAQQFLPVVEAGAAIIGGCCGTTPDHIAALRQAVSHVTPVRRKPVNGVRFAARSGIAVAGSDFPLCVIGERINPTGRKRISRQLRENDFSGVRQDASLQVHRGANLLDINVGVPDADEVNLMVRAVDEVQALLPGTPLSIDSNDPDTLAAGLRQVIGRPLLNSINGSEDRMSRLLPLIVETGANFIALAMDETGIPENAEQRMTIARRIIEQAESMGIDRNRILVDMLVFTVASQPHQPRETLKALQRVQDELGCATVLGVSNVSFGLPDREAITSSFLGMAMGAGLTAGIINPLSDRIMQTIRATELLLNRDAGAVRYVSFIEESSVRAPEFSSAPTSRAHRPVSQQPVSTQQPDTILKAMTEGDKAGLIATIDALLGSGKSPDSILAGELAPAIQEVGRLYGCGTVFLPQLILAGEAMRSAVAHIRPMLAEHRGKSLHGTPLVIGTVEGDIHDIGKNIVAIVLENQGFNIVDLGKNVSPDRFLKAVDDSGARLVALSALMTTTMPAMETTVRKLGDAYPDIRVMVGGAVVTQAFADRIGAHGYAKEAVGAGDVALQLAGLKKLS